MNACSGREETTRTADLGSTPDGMIGVGSGIAAYLRKIVVGRIC